MSGQVFAMLRSSTWGRTTGLAAGLSGARSRVEDVQAQVGSGRRVSSWSDDPGAASAAQRIRAQEADLASSVRQAGDAASWLSAADTALQDTSAVLTRAQDLAVAAGSGAIGDASRAAIAAEIAELRSAVATTANATHLGRPLLGGFTASPLTQDPVSGAWSWNGDGGQQRRQVAPGVTLSVNVDGAAALGFDGPPGTDLLSRLDALAAAVSSGDGAALRTASAGVDAGADRVRAVLGSVGASAARVDRALAGAALSATTLAGDRSRLEDADLADSITQLKAAETAYDAALGAVGRALRLPTLADVLR